MKHRSEKRGQTVQNQNIATNVHNAYLLNACPQPNSPLINRLINDRLLDA